MTVEIREKQQRMKRVVEMVMEVVALLIVTHSHHLLVVAHRCLILWYIFEMAGCFSVIGDLLDEEQLKTFHICKLVKELLGCAGSMDFAAMGRDVDPGARGAEAAAALLTVVLT